MPIENPAFGKYPEEAIEDEQRVKSGGPLRAQQKRGVRARREDDFLPADEQEIFDEEKEKAAQEIAGYENIGHLLDPEEALLAKEKARTEDVKESYGGLTSESQRRLRDGEILAKRSAKPYKKLGTRIFTPKKGEKRSYYSEDSETKEGSRNLHKAPNTMTALGEKANLAHAKLWSVGMKKKTHPLQEAINKKRRLTKKTLKMMNEKEAA